MKYIKLFDDYLLENFNNSVSSVGTGTPTGIAGFKKGIQPWSGIIPNTIINSEVGKISSELQPPEDLSTDIHNPVKRS